MHTRNGTTLACAILIAVTLGPITGCTTPTEAPRPTPTEAPRPTPTPSPTPTRMQLQSTMYVCADCDGVLIRLDPSCQVKTADGWNDETPLRVEPVQADCYRAQSADGRTGYVPARYLCAAPVPCCFKWQDASGLIGQRTCVCGLVESVIFRADVTGQPTFVNVGRDFPDPARFQLVIWGKERPRFIPPPETVYRDRFIKACGVVTLYQSVTQMEVQSPSQITAY